MKNKIILILLIIIGISISVILIYPEIKDYKKVKDDHEYYQSMIELQKNKEEEKENVNNNLYEIDSINHQTNILKSKLEDVNGVIKEKNDKIKELDKKIKSIENKIKNQTKERDRLKSLFE